jgi:hypothetical protein
MTSVAEAGSGGRFGSWRLSWSAVFAGVVLAVAAHIVLGLIGATLGFAAAPADSKGLGAGAGIWALLTPFVATALGAWLACRMANASDQASGNLHGIMVWCIGLIAGALFLTGTMASGAMSAGTAASGNLGSAQRTLRNELGAGERSATAPSPGGGTATTREAREAQARRTGEEAAKGAAAATGGGALASIAGLIGAFAGAALSRRRREGRGLGWRIALQRKDERAQHAQPMASQHAATQGSYQPGSHASAPGAYPTAGAYREASETTRIAGPGEPRVPDAGDPLHH